MSNNTTTAPSVEETLAKLEALGSEKVRAQNSKRGAGDNQYGVKLGDIRKMAKAIKINRELGMALWETGNIDARFLALLIIKPTTLSAEDMDRMVRSIKFDRIADWFNAYIVKKHPDNETLRQGWMDDNNSMAARAGWNLTSIRIANDPEGLDMAAIMTRLESEMGSAAPEVQWTMNFSLVEIGVNFPEHRERALEIGEALGIYRDLPEVKGCTSPYAPIWINEMVSRQN